ncbi:MAG: hypothetical protein JXR76_19065 [Deltaproteobacteria bacterium]|nr:hypothetical protein [Deltaproteobacteria bacterium]
MFTTSDIRRFSHRLATGYSTVVFYLLLLSLPRPSYGVNPAASVTSTDTKSQKTSQEATPKKNEPKYKQPPVQKGVALGLFRQEPNWNYNDFVLEIKQLGASHVAIVVSNYMKTSEHHEIYDLKGYTTPMKTVEKTIAQVKKAGMEVFLFPILRVEDKSNGGWRGTLKPSDSDAFFENYTQYVLRYAEVAAKHNVTLFSIGSELSTMDVHTDKWRAIIRAVRAVYPGKITYSANWDHYDKVEFFDDLDFLGVTGYFQLADKRLPIENNPPLEMLVHSWREVYFRLMRWQHKFDKPLIFTEVGYLSQKGAAAAPWAEGANETVDLEIQRRCYEAFIRVVDNSDTVAGAYFWNWFDWEGENDREYTPREKPAAAEIKSWFTSDSTTPPSISALNATRE